MSGKDSVGTPVIWQSRNTNLPEIMGTQIVSFHGNHQKSTQKTLNPFTDFFDCETEIKYRIEFEKFSHISYFSLQQATINMFYIYIFR